MSCASLGKYIEDWYTCLQWSKPKTSSEVGISSAVLLTISEPCRVCLWHHWDVSVYRRIPVARMLKDDLRQLGSCDFENREYYAEQ